MQEAQSLKEAVSAVTEPARSLHVTPTDCCTTEAPGLRLGVIASNVKTVEPFVFSRRGVLYLD
jgi:hypothetical protein